MKIIKNVAEIINQNAGILLVNVISGIGIAIGQKIGTDLYNKYYTYQDDKNKRIIGFNTKD